VILSSRRVGDLTEITAAREYDAVQDAPKLPKARAQAEKTGRFDEPAASDLTPTISEIQGELGRLRKLFEGELAQLAWRDMSRNEPHRFALLNRLEQASIDRALATALVDAALPCDDLEAAWRKVLGQLGNRIQAWDHDLMASGGVVALLGSTGVGKTITAAKLAARFAQRHGRRHVAFISTDRYKIGGQEQLVSFGSILGVTVQLASTAADLQRTLDSLSERRLVIIDTAGMSQRDLSLADQFGMLGAAGRIKPLLVLPATARAGIIDETIAAFSRLPPAAAILTKLDEGDGMGPLLSSVIRHKLPLAFTTHGQKVPDDLSAAVPQQLLADVIRTYKQSQRVPLPFERAPLPFERAPVPPPAARPQPAMSSPC
jgi:flagellar biosynthesis protein FlhF